MYYYNWGVVMTGTTPFDYDSIMALLNFFNPILVFSCVINFVFLAIMSYEKKIKRKPNYNYDKALKQFRILVFGSFLLYMLFYVIYPLIHEIMY